MVVILSTVPRQLLNSKANSYEFVFPSLINSSIEDLALKLPTHIVATLTLKSKEYRGSIVRLAIQLHGKHPAILSSTPPP